MKACDACRFHPWRAAPGWAQGASNAAINPPHTIRDALLVAGGSLGTADGSRGIAGCLPRSAGRSYLGPRFEPIVRVGQYSTFHTPQNQPHYLSAAVRSVPFS